MLRGIQELPAHGTLSDWPNSASPVASPSTCVVTPVRTLQSPRPIDPHDYDCGHWPLTRPTYGSILQCTKSPSAQSAAGRPTRRLAKVDQGLNYARAPLSQLPAHSA